MCTVSHTNLGRGHINGHLMGKSVLFVDTHGPVMRS